MKFETRRLILRKHKLNDAKDIQTAINNLRISKWLLVVPYPYTLKDAKWWINNCIKNSKLDFVIEYKPDKKVIEGVGLSEVKKEQGTAHIGYWLSENYWRKGIITEALKKLINYGFDKLKLRKLIIPAYADNKASNGVAKSLGFKYEGKLRKQVKCKATGKIHDENVWGLLKSEWKKKK